MNEQSVFIAALEREPAERSRFLDEACQNNPGLRERVERLIASHEAAVSFMDQPAGHLVPTVAQPPDETAGTQIGPYKLLQQIGEGGMGVVYMAEQHQPVRRKVALKIIKPGMDSRQVIARFEAERQALSLMDHPNIAKVLDAGTTDTGRPYFVMELVKGQPITEYCDAKHLTPRQRLELLLPVCQAIQHAHQKGVIHRDIKPSNILVAEYDQRPVPKVIDFGVAKAVSQPLTEKTMFTGYGQVVGTLEYMSPEQAKVNQLDIDTRSDIYSLGVVLYELLTGTTPIDKQRLRSAAWDEMLRIIREEEPPKPSTRLSESKDSLPSVSALRQTEPARLTKLVRGELDWIVMRAMEKDRDHRYETANGFAADIQRYLNDEPVVACPPSATYRLRKFVRRNKSSLSAAAIAMLFVVALGSVLGWAVRDREARRATAEREQQARREKLEARVNQTLDEIRNEYERDDLPEAVARLDRIDALVTDEGDVAQEIRHRVEQWRSELDILQKLEEIHVTDSDLDPHRQMDEMYRQVFAEIGIDVDELPVEESGRRIRSYLTWQRLTETLDSWFWRRHQIYINEGKTPAGRDWKHKLLHIAQTADDDEVRNRVRSIVERWDRAEAERLANSGEVRRLPVSSLFHLTTVIYWGGGEPGRKRAVELLLNAQRKNPGAFRLNKALVNFFGQMDPPRWEEAARYAEIALALRPTSNWVELQLARCCLNLKKFDEANAHYSLLLERNPKTAELYHHFGFAMLVQGKLDECIAYMRKALELDPKNVGAHINLGNGLFKQGDLDEAIACFRKAIELDPKLASPHVNLGQALARQKKVDEAIACYRKALELDPKLADAHHHLGLALINLGKPDEAIAAFRKAIEIRPDFALAHGALGAWLHVQGHHVESLEATRKAIELDPDSALHYVELGKVLASLQRNEEAESAYRRAIELKPDYAPAFTNLAPVLFKLGRHQAAIDVCRKAIELQPTSAAYNNLGIALWEAGDQQAAVDAHRKAIELDPNDWKPYFNLGKHLAAISQHAEAVELLRKALELHPPDPVSIYHFLGVSLRSLGKPSEAETCFRKIIEIAPRDTDAHCNLSLTLGDQNRLVEATTAARTAIALRPDFGMALGQLGYVLVLQGNYSEALPLLRKAIQQLPDSPNTHYALGVALGVIPLVRAIWAN